MYKAIKIFSEGKTNSIKPNNSHLKKDDYDTNTHEVSTFRKRAFLRPPDSPKIIPPSEGQINFYLQSTKRIHTQVGNSCLQTSVKPGHKTMILNKTTDNFIHLGQTRSLESKNHPVIPREKVIGVYFNLKIYKCISVWSPPVVLNITNICTLPLNIQSTIFGNLIEISRNTNSDDRRPGISISTIFKNNNNITKKIVLKSNIRNNYIDVGNQNENPKKLPKILFRIKMKKLEPLNHKIIEIEASTSSLLNTKIDNNNLAKYKEKKTLPQSELNNNLIDNIALKNQYHPIVNENASSFLQAKPMHSQSMQIKTHNCSHVTMIKPANHNFEYQQMNMNTSSNKNIICNDAQIASKRRVQDTVLTNQNIAVKETMNLSSNKNIICNDAQIASEREVQDTVLTNQNIAVKETINLSSNKNIICNDAQNASEKKVQDTVLTNQNIAVKETMYLNMRVDKQQSSTETPLSENSDLRNEKLFQSISEILPISETKSEIDIIKVESDIVDSFTQAESTSNRNIDDIAAIKKFSIIDVMDLTNSSEKRQISSKNFQSKNRKQITKKNYRNTRTVTANKQFVKQTLPNLLNSNLYNKQTSLQHAPIFQNYDTNINCQSTNRNALLTMHNNDSSTQNTFSNQPYHTHHTSSTIQQPITESSSKPFVYVPKSSTNNTFFNQAHNTFFSPLKPHLTEPSNRQSVSVPISSHQRLPPQTQQTAEMFAPQLNANPQVYNRLPYFHPRNASHNFNLPPSIRFAHTTSQLNNNFPILRQNGPQSYDRYSHNNVQHSQLNNNFPILRQNGPQSYDRYSHNKVQHSQYNRNYPKK